MNGFFRLQSKFDLFSSLHLSYLEIGQCLPPSSGRLAWQNSAAEKLDPFSSSPNSEAPPVSDGRPFSSFQLDGGNGGPEDPPVANGENEWFVFLGGGVGYYTQTSRILWGGFEWWSIATHNQDPTWNIIVENPTQIGGIFWGGKTPLQKMPFAGFTIIH